MSTPAFVLVGDGNVTASQLANTVFAACQRARTAQEFSGKFVNHIARATSSEFSIWFDLESTQLTPLALTPGAEPHLAQALTLASGCRMKGARIEDSIALVPLLSRAQAAGILALGNSAGSLAETDLPGLIEVGKLALAQYESLRLRAQLSVRAPLDDAESIVAHLAHEMRQSLSALSSSAYYLRMIIPRHQTHTRAQLDKMQRQIEQISWVVSDAVHTFEFNAEAKPVC